MIINDELKSNDCFLCRIIGHKWAVYDSYQINAAKAKHINLSTHCIRCGKPIPDGMKVIEKTEGS